MIVEEMQNDHCTSAKAMEIKDNEGNSRENDAALLEVTKTDKTTAINVATLSSTSSNTSSDEKDKEIEQLKSRLEEAETDVQRLLKLSHDLCQYSTSLSRQVTTLRRENRRLCREKALTKIADVEDKKWSKQFDSSSNTNEEKCPAPAINVERNIRNHGSHQDTALGKILQDKKTSNQKMKEWNARLDNFVERRKSLREESMNFCKRNESNLAELSNAVRLKRSSMTVDMEVAASVLSKGQHEKGPLSKAQPSLKSFGPLEDSFAEEEVVPFDKSFKVTDDSSPETKERVREETAAHWKQKVDDMAQKLRDSEIQKNRLMLQLSATTSNAAASALMKKNNNEHPMHLNAAVGHSSTRSFNSSRRSFSSISFEERRNGSNPQFKDCSETVKRASFILETSNHKKVKVEKV